MTRTQFTYGISCVFHVDFCISCGISDFTHISEFHCGFLDFSVDFCILPWISGFHRGFENFSPRFSPQPTENSTVCSSVWGVCSIRPLSSTVPFYILEVIFDGFINVI